MSTLRFDPTTRTWVILAPRRAGRPHLPDRPHRPILPRFDAGCPFCPGNEHLTPPEVARVSQNGRGSAWRARVVPNLYAALDGDGSPASPDGDGFTEELGAGRHEVIIESPRHDDRFDRMEVDELARILLLWRDRFREHAGGSWAKAVVVFKNFGASAGASLEHLHSQVMATPVATPEAVRRVEAAERHFAAHGRSLYDQLVEAERAHGARLVASQGGTVAFVPFASGMPFEAWIVPGNGRASFSSLSEGSAPEVGWVLRETLRGLRGSASDPDYNLIVVSTLDGEAPSFRWHLRLVPKLAIAAGFEIGSGMSINTVRPEDAAAAMRDAIAE